MSHRIADLSTEELLDVVQRGGLDDLQLLEVLRSPYCSAQIAELVATDRKSLSMQSVREKLAGFPGLSNSRAMNLLGSLSWASLIAVAQSPRTPPLVRRQAERKLILQMPSLTRGEKIAVARRAHRALLPALIAGDDERILNALLDNPRMVENDLVVLITTGDPPVEFLTSVARHHRWGRSYRVRVALVEAPATPLPLALSVLVQLPKHEQRNLAGRTDLSERLRSAAEALAARPDGERRSASGIVI
ncbi:MAG: hypothetical protein V2I67_10945 [Thermoanaerobaculales bacterium]|nr:hypothetical protein [Thermoanaerobaculales bacterium]